MSTFTRYEPDTASAEGKKILEGIKGAYGFIPELFSYMIEAPVAVEAYIELNKLLGRSSFTPAQLQAALLAVSVQNECAFCTVAHEAMAKKSGTKAETIKAIKNNEQIEDAKDQALVKLVRQMVEKRGWVPEEDLQEFFAAGFTRQQVFELIVVVAIKTLSNYSNHLTHPEPNKELLAMIAQ